MNKLEQMRTPFLDAMKEYVKSNPIPFDVPGHKMGRLKNDFTDFVGEMVYKSDINAPIGLDNLYHPTGVIKDAENLLADAYGATDALFLINGTSSGIMTMIVGIINAKDKIILPRNVHKSVINSLIMSGGIPIFVEPDIDEETGIANGMPLYRVIEAMDNNRDAKAIFVINPTYFGVTSDLESIVKAAHERGIIVMVDEAHGSHFAFSPLMPKSAMEAGADISAMSLHKTGGSLTQSSALLIRRDLINYSRILKVYSMFSSTSPSHLLLGSMDAARKMLALNGEELIFKAVSMARTAREAINKMPGLKCMDNSYCTGDGRFQFDETRLVVRVNDLGLSGFEVLRILKKEFNIQLELAEVSLILAIVSIGTLQSDVDKLVEAMKYLSDKYYEDSEKKIVPVFHYSYPELVTRPREAFHAPSKIVKLEDSVGEISAESVMVYPPGIPILIPGEIVSSDALELLQFYEEQGGVMLSDSKDGYIKVIDQEIWYKGSDLDYDF